MRRLLLLLCILIRLSNAVAQQRPQFTQYFFNNFLINPAITGIERYIDVKAGYRNQWVGLSGAPITSFVYAYAPIGKSYISSNAGSFSENGNNPNSRSYMQTYMAAEPHHGVGFHVVTDQSGPFNSTALNATYAYHMGLAPRLNLSVGVSGGISMDKLDLSKIDVVSQNDPAVIATANLGTKINPDAGLGLWLYGPTFFVGASVQQLLGSLSKITIAGQEVPHYYLTGGYKFFISDEISLIPSAMIKYASPTPVSFDLNAKAMFKDIFWLGAGYRKNDSFSAMAGFNISSLLNISYAYDISTSQLRTVSNGSHEIVLGLLLNNKYRVTCPQMLW